MSRPNLPLVDIIGPDSFIILARAADVTVSALHAIISLTRDELEKIQQGATDALALICEPCDGSGDFGPTGTCPNCHGTGLV